MGRTCRHPLREMARATGAGEVIGRKRSAVVVTDPTAARWKIEALRPVLRRRSVASQGGALISGAASGRREPATRPEWQTRRWPGADPRTNPDNGIGSEKSRS